MVSSHIPTKGKLGSGLWQALKGLYFEGTAPTANEPAYAGTVTFTDRAGTVTLTDRAGTVTLTDRAGSATVVPT